MENRQTYSFDEAYQASLAYFGGDELAARVWVNKYALKDSYGNIFEKTPADMHWRIANEVARIESKYENPLSAEQVFEVLDHFKYIVPAGSPMTGIGNNFQVASLSNCFVVGLDGDADSYGVERTILHQLFNIIARPVFFVQLQLTVFQYVDVNLNEIVGSRPFPVAACPLTCAFALVKAIAISTAPNVNFLFMVYVFYDVLLKSGKRYSSVYLTYVIKLFV